MVELTRTVSEQQDRERGIQIFQNIFSEIFLANCGNPLDFQTTKQKIEKKMKLEFNEGEKLESFEKFFLQADTSKVNALTKE